MCFVITEEARVRLWSAREHALFLTAVLGTSNSLGILLLCSMSLAQAAACGALLVPYLHKRMFTWIPSALLGTTLLIEFAVYKAYTDSQSTCKLVCIMVCLSMIALLRGDACARRAALSAPLFETALSIEAAIRRACTCGRFAMVLGPVLAALLINAVAYLSYWRCTGAEYEMKRAAFSTSMAKCAVLAFLVGQDKSETLFVADRVVSAIRAANAFLFPKAGPRALDKKL